VIVLVAIRNVHLFRSPDISSFPKVGRRTERKGPRRGGERKRERKTQRQGERGRRGGEKKSNKLMFFV